MNREQKWTTAQFQRRLDSLIRDGFTPEEAFTLANWSVPLNHWVIERMRRARRSMMTRFRREGLGADEIQERLDERYLELGIRGQYEDEAWYFSRTGAAT
jgi:hypothetical protein